MKIKILSSKIFKGCVLLSLLWVVGCTMPKDVGCVPIHIGTGYDEDGMREFIYTNEVGCPRIEER